MTDIGWLELGRTLPYFELTMWVIKKLSNGYGLASVSQTTEFKQGTDIIHVRFIVEIFWSSR